jgi:NAD(P)-dependent dehydrogenase (short-subunit alcohol dehydrogenase family)
MRERKSGKIVNISSTAGHSTDGRPLYSTAKAGVNHFTKMLAQQLRPYNVTCNALSPGPTRSGRWLANTGTFPHPALMLYCNVRYLTGWNCCCCCCRCC